MICLCADLIMIKLINPPLYNFLFDLRFLYSHSYTSSLFYKFNIFFKHFYVALLCHHPIIRVICYGQ